MADVTQAVPVPNSTNAATGSSTVNPYLPQTVGQQQVPTYSNAMAQTTPTSGAGDLNIFNQTGTNTNGQPNWVPSEHDFVKAMRKAGFSAGDAALMYNFISSGAGFNMDVAQKLLQSMNPQIERGQANILEQFGAKGLRNSSTAAIGFGDYMGQIEATQQNIVAQMYEQSVQNYMQILLGGKGQYHSTFENLMTGLQTISGMASSAGQMMTGMGNL